MSPELQKKVDRAIKLIQSAGRGGYVVEVAYSGGKDSDVILELTRMSGIKYRAIYKNTTIDPPGTIAHVIEKGVEVLQPKKRFFELVEEAGFPNRYARFCCRYLKEYKILDKCIMGVRKSESVRRSKRYTEPTECRFFGSKKEHVEAFYPILDWTDEDVVEFITDRGIKIHKLYYREDGTIDPKRRLGCMACPLAYVNKRIKYFKAYPGLVKAYIRAGQKYRENHPDTKTCKAYHDIYEWFVKDVFYNCRKKQWDDLNSGFFDTPDYKKFLEDYFKIKL